MFSWGGFYFPGIPLKPSVNDHKANQHSNGLAYSIMNVKIGISMCLCYSFGINMTKPIIASTSKSIPELIRLKNNLDKHLALTLQSV
jgi:hypothetical protein